MLLDTGGLGSDVCLCCVGDGGVDKVLVVAKMARLPGAVHQGLSSCMHTDQVHSLFVRHWGLIRSQGCSSLHACIRVWGAVVLSPVPCTRSLQPCMSLMRMVHMFILILAS